MFCGNFSRMSISLSLNIVFICAALLLQDEGTKDKFSQDKVIFELISPHDPELLSTPVSNYPEPAWVSLTQNEVSQYKHTLEDSLLTPRMGKWI